MLIFGYKNLVTEEFYWIEKEPFKQGINCFFYDETMVTKAKEQGFEFGILVREKDEIFLAQAFGAKYLLFFDEELAKFGAKVAEFYLFDSKTLLLVKELTNLENAYKIGVDGVILKHFMP